MSPMSKWERILDSYEHYRSKVGLGRVRAAWRAWRYEATGRDS